jgi:hypothetical protein
MESKGRWPDGPHRVDYDGDRNGVLDSKRSAMQAVEASRPPSPLAGILMQEEPQRAEWGAG